MKAYDFLRIQSIPLSSQEIEYLRRENITLKRLIYALKEKTDNLESELAVFDRLEEMLTNMLEEKDITIGKISLRERLGLPPLKKNKKQ